MKEITVNGKAAVSAPPDTAEIKLTVQGESAEYEKCAEITLERARLLGDAATAAGLDVDCLRTDDYNVSAKYENERSADGNYKQVFAGYKCTQNMTLRFAFDKALLGKVLAKMGGSGAEATYEIRFTVKDEQEYVQKALRLAVDDAKQKAEIIADAIGAKLTAVQSVSYGSSIPRAYSETNCRPMLMRAAAAPDITPSDVQFTDSVTVVWGIQ